MFQRGCNKPSTSGGKQAKGKKAFAEEKTTSTCTIKWKFTTKQTKRMRRETEFAADSNSEAESEKD